jgi:hypothetical protein
VELCYHVANSILKEVAMSAHGQRLRQPGDLLTRRGEIERISAEAVQLGCSVRGTLKRITERYPDATAAEIADALRIVWHDTGQPKN